MRGRTDFGVSGDFEDEWEDIGRYLLSTGWDVEEDASDKHMWEYGAKHTGLGVTGGDRGWVLVIADLPTGPGEPGGGRTRRDGTYEVALHLPKIIGSKRLSRHERNKQRYTFFAVLSDLFGDVSIVDGRRNRYSIPSIGSRDISWKWENAYTIFKIVPSAEDVIGIIEAFVVTQREMSGA
jgi:hypothetical protein